MTLTLLFDLDDTLIANQVDSFTKAYISALAQHLADQVDPRRMVPALMAAVQALIENQRPDFTLEQVFDRSFYPAVGILRPDVQQRIDDFYANVYPDLHQVTRPRPGAVAVVRQAIQLGYRVSVATNPLFPRTAILQRLDWAGLPATVVPYSIIASYETFHFAKPNPAFFTEVLAQMGWPDGPAVMIGNDPQNDTLPAAQAGLFTYLLTKESAQDLNDQDHGQGNLDQLLAWLQELEDRSPKMDLDRPIALMAVLKSTPAALDQFSKNVTSTQWSWQPQPGEWSLGEIICHLRDVAIEVDLPRLEKVMSENNPFIPGMVTDVWADERHYHQQDGAQALKDFLDARIQLIQFLDRLTPEDWERPARHAIFGPTTLRELVGFIATHDRSHIQQSYEALQVAKRQAV